MDWLKGPAGLSARRTFAESLVKVSVSLEGGAACKLTDWLSIWRFWPSAPATCTLIIGRNTVAVIDVALRPFGVENPAGLLNESVAGPGASGWKLVGAKFVSPVKTTGLVTMVPTVGSELVTGILTVRPVRRFWKLWVLRVAGSSWTVAKFRGVSEENVVVLKPALAHSIPEGVRVTVAVPLLYPVALAVRLALPELARPSIEKVKEKELAWESGRLMD